MNINHGIGKVIAWSALLFATSAIVVACGGGGGMGGNMSVPASTVSTSVTMTGDQQVPPVSTGGVGTGTVTVDTMTYAISGSFVIDGILNTEVTAAHIHDGATGGAVIIPMTRDAGDPNKWNIPAGSMLSVAQFTDFNNGALYFNAHTNTNTGGEIRGQIGRQVFVATTMTGRQAGTTATGTGAGLVVLNPSTSRADVSYTVTGLTGAATAGHIHTGAVGVSGGVVVPMTETPPGSGTFVASNVDFTVGSLLTDLRAGNLYFNVHTTMFPNGELRGQIGRVVRFGDMGNNEVPPTGATGTGTGFGVLDEATRTLAGSETGTGLTGAAKAAHIHQGATGSSGGVIVPFTVTDDGTVSGTFSASGSTVVSADNAKAFLDGNTYLNVHTTMFPSGEIRGQLNIQ